MDDQHHCAECCPFRKERPVHYGWKRKAFETTLTVVVTTAIVLLLKALGI